jgi:hypothetical protein
MLSFGFNGVVDSDYFVNESTKIEKAFKNNITFKSCALHGKCCIIVDGDTVFDYEDDNVALAVLCTLECNYELSNWKEVLYMIDNPVLLNDILYSKTTDSDKALKVICACGFRFRQHEAQILPDMLKEIKIVARAYRAIPSNRPGTMPGSSIKDPFISYKHYLYKCKNKTIPVNDIDKIDIQELINIKNLNHCRLSETRLEDKAYIYILKRDKEINASAMSGCCICLKEVSSDSNLEKEIKTEYNINIEYLSSKTVWRHDEASSDSIYEFDIPKLVTHVFDDASPNIKKYIQRRQESKRGIEVISNPSKPPTLEDSSIVLMPNSSNLDQLFSAYLNKVSHKEITFLIVNN